MKQFFKFMFASMAGFLLIFIIIFFIMMGIVMSVASFIKKGNCYCTKEHSAASKIRSGDCRQVVEQSV